MSASFPLATFPDSKKITFADTNAVQVMMSAKLRARKVSIYFATSAGWVAFTGTDGAAINANAVPVPADSWHVFDWTDGSSGLFVSGSAAAVCYVMVESGRT